MLGWCPTTPQDYPEMEWLWPAKRAGVWVTGGTRRRVDQENPPSDLHGIADVPGVDNDDPRSTVISCILRAVPDRRPVLFSNASGRIGRGNAIRGVSIVICRCVSGLGADFASDRRLSAENQSIAGILLPTRQARLRDASSRCSEHRRGSGAP
jgi:hypothetical protein